MFQSVAQNSLDMLKPKRGETILDVGCGLGIDAMKFAGMGAKTTGVDASQRILQKAWSNVATSIGKNLAITFKRGREENLIEMFGDGSFDGVYASRLLEHVEDPRATLRRFGRVVRRGGRVVVAEPDWATMTIDHPNKEMTNKILKLFQNSVRHPFVGRELRRTMRELGYNRMTMRAVPVVFVDPISSGLIDGIETFVQQGLLGGSSNEEKEDVERYIDTCKKLKKESGFTSSLTMYVVMGSRPKDTTMVELPPLDGGASRRKKEKEEEEEEEGDNDWSKDKEEEMNHYELVTEEKMHNEEKKKEEEKKEEEKEEEEKISPQRMKKDAEKLRAANNDGVPPLPMLPPTETNIARMTLSSEKSEKKSTIEGVNDFQFVPLKQRDHDQEGVVQLPAWEEE